MDVLMNEVTSTPAQDFADIMDAIEAENVRCIWKDEGL